MAQSRANQCETQCISLQDDNAGLSCQVARAEGQLVVTQAKLRCAVLCCAVPCCAVPCCAVPCCPVPCRAVLCRPVLYCAVLCKHSKHHATFTCRVIET